MEQQGEFLKYASDRLRNDKSLVMLAVNSDPDIQSAARNQ
ncbi:DUF4116 domain-containing protein [Endozoicomonas sp. YOMI1]